VAAFLCDASAVSVSRVGLRSAHRLLDRNAALEGPSHSEALLAEEDAGRTTTESPQGEQPQGQGQGQHKFTVTAAVVKANREMEVDSHQFLQAEHGGRQM
jgi:hypothetical protein